MHLLTQSQILRDPAGILISSIEVPQQLNGAQSILAALRHVASATLAITTAPPSGGTHRDSVVRKYVFLRIPPAKMIAKATASHNQPLKNGTASMSDLKPAASVNVPQLIEDWRNGDQKAAEVIFDRYQNRLLMLVSGHLNDKLRRRMDPEDLVQSIMRSVFRVTGQQDIGCRDETGFWKWLVTIALNKTFNRIDRETAGKRSPKREAGSDSVLDDRILSEPTPSDVVEVAELLEKILAKLNDVQGKILLAKLDGLTHAEMAAQLGVSSKTIQRNGHAIREAAIEVMGADVPEWLLPSEPSLADQFVDCLNEPANDWLPRDVAKSLGASARQTLGQVLHAAQPDPEVLNGIRSAAKQRGNRSDSETPQLFCAAIYLLAIAAAKVRLGMSLSTASDEVLASRLKQILRCNWISTQERELLNKLASSTH